MKKELSIRQLFIDSLGFIGNNIPLLAFFTVLSFLGSYFSVRFPLFQQRIFLLGYLLYIYFFYYAFVGLYYEQSPLFTKEKTVDSLIKLLSIFAFSMLVLICGRLGINVVRYFSKTLIGFPDIYSFLREIYLFMKVNPHAQILIYLGVIILLSFSFFIPGFAWISIINGQDNSIITAYDKARGNIIKTVAVFVLLFGLLPLFISFLGLQTTPVLLAIFYAVLTVFQIIVYLHLYDFFYLKENTAE